MTTRMFGGCAACQLYDGSGALPGGKGHIGQKLFFGADRVGAGRLHGIETAEDEGAVERYLLAAAARNHGFGIFLWCESLRRSAGGGDLARP